MEGMIELGRRVVAQTKQRLFKGVTHAADKIVSVFEPETRILRRGKAHKPTEFGQVVKVQEAEGGIVTDIAVVVLGHLKLTHLGQQKLTHPADVAAAGRLARTS
jgi:hypothetical protein